MASTSPNSKTVYHVRSNSLPSKKHPLIVEADEHLCRLKASFQTSSSSSTSQSLTGLQDLYACVHQLLLLPLTHKALLQDISCDELLEGSLRLLDLSETTKDLLLQTKEFTSQLKSLLRRRRSCEVGFGNELRKCLTTRKTIKKAIQKVLKGIIQTRNVEKNAENIDMFGLMKEVESVTFQIMKSLLSFISGSKLTSKMSNFAIVSKLMGSRRVANDDEESNTVNEIDALDAALVIIASTNKTVKSNQTTQIVNLKDSLEKFETSIEDLEENLEILCRHLIKIRVSFLNIFNN